MSISTRWVFTINNYTNEDIASISSWDTKYCIFGKEVAPTTGTPHLQGFCIFSKNHRLTAVKKLHASAFWEAAKTSSAACSKYCKKSNDFVETGSLGQSGKRNDIRSFMETVNNGVYDKKRLRAEHPEICSKYPRFVNDYVSDQIPTPAIEPHPLRDWQADLNARLNRPPNRREIIFVVDYEGNKGKSWFASYYADLHSNVSIMRPTKHSDMAYALPDILRVFFLDCTRQQIEHLPYSFLESLKDGLVMSIKYESRVRHYPPMHVVVLLNQDPDMSLLSADRYTIINI